MTKLLTHCKTQQAILLLSPACYYAGQRAADSYIEMWQLLTDTAKWPLFSLLLCSSAYIWLVTGWPLNTANSSIISQSSVVFQDYLWNYSISWLLFSVEVEHVLFHFFKVFRVTSFTLGLFHLESYIFVKLSTSHMKMNLELHHEFDFTIYLFSFIQDFCLLAT